MTLTKCEIKQNFVKISKVLDAVIQLTLGKLQFYYRCIECFVTIMFITYQMLQPENKKGSLNSNESAENNLLNLSLPCCLEPHQLLPQQAAVSENLNIL